MTGLPVRAEALEHRYGTGLEEVVVLDGVDFLVPSGAAAAVVGPSGTGKSTLLTVLAGLQRPTAGTVRIGEMEITALGERALLTARAQHIAVVAQRPDLNVLGWASVEDNIHFAQLGPRAAGRRDLPDPDELLARLGLAELSRLPVDRLSGGQRQRLALGTGLALGPDVLLIDEPTSQLDSDTAAAVIDLLIASAASGTTIVAVTHDPRVGAAMDLSLQLRHGRLVG